MDDDQIFKTRLNNRNPTCEARAVLVLLGFEGVLDFARRTGINHETAGTVLGTIKKAKHKKHHYILVTANEALHTAFIERKQVLTRAARAYVCDWIKRWHKESLSGRLFVEAAARQSTVRKGSNQSRAYKQEKTKAGVMTAFKSLEWKP